MMASLDPSLEADLGATGEESRQEHKIKDAQQPPGWGHGARVITASGIVASMTSKHLPFTPLPEKVHCDSITTTPSLYIRGPHDGKGMGQATYLFLSSFVELRRPISDLMGKAVEFEVHTVTGFSP